MLLCKFKIWFISFWERLDLVLYTLETNKYISNITIVPENFNFEKL